VVGYDVKLGDEGYHAKRTDITALKNWGEFCRDTGVDERACRRDVRAVVVIHIAGMPWMRRYVLGATSWSDVLP